MTGGCFLFPNQNMQAVAYADAVDLPGARCAASAGFVHAVANDVAVRFVYPLTHSAPITVGYTDTPVPGGATEMAFVQIGESAYALLAQTSGRITALRLGPYFSIGQPDEIETGGHLTMPDMADLDHDGFDDMVYADTAVGVGTVTVRKNQSGFFPARVDTPGIPGTVVDTRRVELATGDAVVVATSEEIYVMRPQSDLSLQYVNQTTGQPQSSPLGAEVAFGRTIRAANILARPDLFKSFVVASLSGPPGLAVLEVHADGTLGAPVFHARPTDGAGELSRAAVADFDGDARADVAALDATTGEVIVWRGGAEGLMDPGAPVALDSGAASLSAADVNADHRPDLVLSFPGQGQARALFNDRTGGFLSRRSKALASQPREMISGDFDGDGLSDLLLVNTTDFTLYRGDPLNPGDVVSKGVSVGNPVGAGFHTLPIRPAVVAGAQTGFALFDGVKITVCRLGPPTPVWIATVVQTIAAPPTSSFTDYDVGDIDADGDDDIAVLLFSLFDRRVQVFLQQPDGTFAAPEEAPSSGSFLPSRLRIGNFVSGGRLDIAVLGVGAGLGRVQVFRGEQSGGFTALDVQALGDPQTDIVAAGDVDGEGADGLVAAQSVMVGGETYRYLRVFHNAGAGAFALSHELFLSSGEIVETLSVRDIDGDGFADVLVSVRETSAADTTTCWRVHAVLLERCIGCPMIAGPLILTRCGTGQIGPRFTHLEPPPHSAPGKRGATLPGLAFVYAHEGGARLRTSPNLAEFHQPCPGDTNGDRVVDFHDLNAVLSDFGAAAPPGALPGDLDADGDCDFIDLNIVLSFFGSAC